MLRLFFCTFGKPHPGAQELLLLWPIENRVGRLGLSFNVFCFVDVDDDVDTFAFAIEKCFLMLSLSSCSSALRVITFSKVELFLTPWPRFLRFRDLRSEWSEGRSRRSRSEFFSCETTKKNGETMMLLSKRPLQTAAAVLCGPTWTSS